jgi:hypothetical protein
VQLFGWLERSGYLGRRRAAADLLDVHEATLAQFLNGDRTPGLAKGVDIAEKTGVPVRAWTARLAADAAAAFLVVRRNARRHAGKWQGANG